MIDGGGREGQGRSRLGGGREVRGRTGLREEPVLPARRAPVPSPVQRSRRVGVLGFGPQSGSGVARGRARAQHVCEDGARETPVRCPCQASPSVVTATGPIPGRVSDPPGIVKKCRSLGPAPDSGVRTSERCGRDSALRGVWGGAFHFLFLNTQLQHGYAISFSSERSKVLSF